MITVLAIMSGGIVLGIVLKKYAKLIGFTEKLITYAIWFLLFVLGISIGTNEAVVHNIGTLGFQGLVITFCAVAGSVLLAWLVSVTLLKNEE